MKQGTKTILWASALGIPAAVIAAVIAWNLTEGLRYDPPIAVPTSSRSSPGPSDPGPAPSSDDPSPLPTPVAAVFTPLPLTVDGAVGGERCKVDGNSGVPWREGEGSSIAGEFYTSSLECGLGRSGTVGYLDYLVPRGATRFTAVAGQPDDVRNTTLIVRFEVIDTVSGTVLAAHDLAYAQPQPLDVVVDGLTRVTLKVSLISWGVDPYESNGAGQFADPRFR